MSGEKIRLNTEWLCDCGGCHVALVDLHEKILNVLESVEILKCPVLTDEKNYPAADIGILTGSVRTEHDRHAALEMRKACKTIIAFGTCAVYGGLHGAGLAHSREEIMDHVYRQSPTTQDRFSAEQFGERPGKDGNPHRRGDRCRSLPARLSAPSPFHLRGAQRR